MAKSQFLQLLCAYKSESTEILRCGPHLKLSVYKPDVPRGLKIDSVCLHPIFDSGNSKSHNFHATISGFVKSHSRGSCMKKCYDETTNNRELQQIGKS